MRGIIKRIYDKVHAQRFVMQLLIIILAVVADQATKAWIMPMLEKLPEKSMPVIEGAFRLTFVENEGASFGILQGKRWFFIIATALTLIVLGFYMVSQRKKQGLWLRTCLSLLMAGAAGNFLDRLFNVTVVGTDIKRGLVRDFLDFSQIGFPWIFNVADMCLVVGSIMLGIYLLFIHKEKDGKPLFARRGKKQDASLDDDETVDGGEDETKAKAKPEKE